ncbi:Protein CBG25628 [Caenorhabditis briggsae]|uniref:Protein CBG25628 n=1 Tax=Caenorhabditis briggsae TaxID=6238 RepID=B6IFB2_CAEBR|nr:Protein CBG25628 [Caenorhabditis briggsae]CAR98592.1 Protein CBG25628 [Caenorhabditis briggsae]
MPAFKSKDLNRNRTFLLEFLWNLLNNPTHHDIIVWENKKELVFRIMNKDAVAVLWGQKKGGKAMNYEKLSRALRHFYGTHVKKLSTNCVIIWNIICEIDSSPTNRYGHSIYFYPGTCSIQRISSKISIPSYSSI